MIHLLPDTYRAFYGAFHRLHPIQQQAVEPILAHKDLILQSATGSGKTTTVYSCLRHIINPQMSVITAEEPVEYVIDGISQCSINPKIGLTYEETLRHILRQDPDVVLVGEIRDFETAEVAIKAAMTGHLVLSTLHTNDAPQTVTRLVNMGVPSYNITSALNLVMAQRLVRELQEDGSPA